VLKSQMLHFKRTCLYLYCQKRRYGDWEPINLFNTTTCVCLSQTRTWSLNSMCHGLYCVQWSEVLGDCSFCWHWWNCWPSLFKLSFHSKVDRG